MARLHAGLAIDAIIENDHGEITWLLDADGCERAKPHQHLSVTRDHRHPSIRLREREPQSDHGRSPHRTPEIEIAIVVAGGSGIPGRRAKARYDQQVVAASGEQCGHRRAVPALHLVHTFRPISSCDRITAAMRSSPKACWRARSALSVISAGARAR